MDELLNTINKTFDEYRTLLLIVSGTVLTGWLFNKYWINRKFVLSKHSLTGKTVLITGGNTGIGYETAKQLLLRDARVIIACRNLTKGHEAVEKLVNETKCNKNNLNLMACDLCSFDSIRNFARLYLNTEQRLDILICNAGLGYSSEKMTIDGFNTVIQANYLGHFLLTNLLLKKLKESQPSRIINVSSDLHKTVKTIDWPDAFTQLNQSSIMGAYSPSKVFQILSTYQLKQDLLNEGVNSFALTPGLVSTSIKDPIEESVGFLLSLIYTPLALIMKFLFAKTPESGAQTTVYCAIEPTLENSKELYFQNCAVSKSSPLSTDSTLAQQLWTLSSNAVGL